MVKKIIFVLILTSVMFACGSIAKSFNIASNMQKVEIGMTKPEVVSIVGDGYRVLSAVQTADGKFETIQYLESSASGWYSLVFHNGRLVEVQKELPIDNQFVENSMKRLKLGMTKQEVVGIMGSDYKVAGASQTSKGNYETLRYYDNSTQQWYSLVFRDGNLLEWAKELPSASPVRPRR